MNKKGIGQVGAIFIFLIFLVNWFIWLGGWVNTICLQVITDNSLTGIEAFFFYNFNFIIVIAMFLGMMGWMYFSAQ